MSPLYRGKFSSWVPSALIAMGHLESPTPPGTGNNGPDGPRRNPDGVKAIISRHGDAAGGGLSDEQSDEKM
jgi:hypothetical protein